MILKGRVKTLTDQASILDLHFKVEDTNAKIIRLQKELDDLQRVKDECVRTFESEFREL